MQHYIGLPSYFSRQGVTMSRLYMSRNSYIDQVYFKLLESHLILPPEYWDQKYMPPRLAHISFFLTSQETILQLLYFLPQNKTKKIYNLNKILLLNLFLV